MFLYLHDLGLFVYCIWLTWVFRLLVYLFVFVLFWLVVFVYWFIWILVLYCRRFWVVLWVLYCYWLLSCVVGFWFVTGLFVSLVMIVCLLLMICCSGCGWTRFVVVVFAYLTVLFTEYGSDLYYWLFIFLFVLFIVWDFVVVLLVVV